MVLLAVLLLPGLFASRVQADAQGSLRGFMEFGKQRKGDLSEFIFGIGTRGDVLFGAAKPNRFRIGPAYELRTVDFYSAEGAGGASMLIPLGIVDLPIVLTGLGGYAVRRRGPETPMAIGVASWGWRGYNYSSSYGWALNLFFSARKSLGDRDVVEFTGGIECDLQIVLGVPALAIKNALTGKDPHESE